MKIFLAGGQELQLLELLIDADAPFVLMSHFYMQRKSKGEVERILRRAKEHGCRIFMDSGTFTFNEKGMYVRSDFMDKFDWDTEKVRERKLWAEEHNADNALKRLRKEIDEYFNGYLEYLPLYGEYCEMIAELDVDHFVPDIWAYRAKYPKEVIPKLVVTSHEHWNDEEEMDRLIDFGVEYMGVEAVVSFENVQSWFARFGPKLTAAKMKVHGWAGTKQKVIAQIPYYSVDSTTWLSGQRFGTTFMYEGNRKMKTYDYTRKKEIRESLKTKVSKYNVDFDELMADDWRAVSAWNAAQWVAFARDEALDVSKAYWLTSAEKAVFDEEAADQFGTKRTLTKWQAEREANHAIRLAPARMDLRAILPRMCNTCFLGAKCPGFERDAACTFDFKPGLETKTDFKDLVKTIASSQFERAHHAVLIEKVNGGMPSKEVGKELELAMNLAVKADQVINPRASFSMHATGSVPIPSSDGGDSDAPQGGILSRMFGGYGKSGQGNPAQRAGAEHAESQVVDADFDAHE